MYFLDIGKINRKRLIKKNKRIMKKEAFIKKVKNIRGKGFKALCWIIEIHAIICITLSYVLAFLDKMNPLETLSSTITTEIVAPIVVLGFTRMVENIFEHNKLSFSTPLKHLNKEEDKKEDGFYG